MEAVYAHEDGAKDRRPHRCSASTRVRDLELMIERLSIFSAKHHLLVSPEV